MTFRILLVEKLPVWVRFFVTFWVSTRMRSLCDLHLASLNLQILMPSISISHAAGTVVLAVSEAAQLSGGPIGVDIEPMDEVSPLAVSRMAATEERAWIDAAGNQRDRCRRMCQVWTRIEAVLKAQGSGFSVDPGKDGLPDGWNVSFTEYDGGVISCAARFVPQIVLKEHVFYVG